MNISIDKFNHLLEEDVVEEAKKKPKKLGYIYEPDKVSLSYSRLQTFRNCPRKFLLNELNQQGSFSGSIHTAYGSAFGAGVQELFRSGSFRRAVIAAFSEWDYEGFVSPYPKDIEKSFWSCVATLSAFCETEFQRLSQQYQLAYLENKPGIELFVYISLTESYNYQLHIDLILQDKETKALAVGEIKTSSMAQQEANWANSEQTLGYYAVLEFLSKKYGYIFDPKVLYITSQAGKYLEGQDNCGFRTFEFHKNPNESLDFARNIVLDIETIELYIEHKYFPKRGNNCVNYGRVCDFFGRCDMKSLQDPERAEIGSTYESLSLDDADFKFDMSSLIKTLEID